MYFSVFSFQKKTFDIVMQKDHHQEDQTFAFWPISAD